jgi:hypothetical protein
MKNSQETTTRLRIARFAARVSVAIVSYNKKNVDKALAFSGSKILTICWL